MDHKTSLLRRQQERLTKAHQAADLLRADLQEAHQHAQCPACQDFLLESIGQVERLRQKLERMAESDYIA
jgi:transposase